MPDPIDLRSDTVTHPTQTMRHAMAEAEVGDDVLGEDPTVNRLEQVAAEMMGKEAALFAASGTMSNLISALTHCGRGDEIIMGSEAHMFWNEVGGAATLAGYRSGWYPTMTREESTLRTWQQRFGPRGISTSLQQHCCAWRTPTTAATVASSAPKTPRLCPM